MILQHQRHHTITPPLSSGILIPITAELATILITLLICRPYNLWIPPK